MMVTKYLRLKWHKDLLNTYKYGWKTSYYQNTYDAKKDGDEPAHPIGWYDEEKKVD